MFRAPLQHITVPRGMAIARAMSAKFKEFFISGQLKVILVIWYSVSSGGPPTPAGTSMLTV